MEEKLSFIKLKSFKNDVGKSPADCLIQEIQKKKWSFLINLSNLSQRKIKKSIFNGLTPEHYLKYKEYKNPQVRIKYNYIYLLFLIKLENSHFIKKTFRNTKISSIK